MPPKWQQQEQPSRSQPRRVRSESVDEAFKRTVDEANAVRRRDRPQEAPAARPGQEEEDEFFEADENNLEEEGPAEGSDLGDAPGILSSIERTQTPEMSQPGPDQQQLAAQLAALQSKIARLEAENATLRASGGGGGGSDPNNRASAEPGGGGDGGDQDNNQGNNRGSREASIASVKSAWEGDKFTPKGMAAWPAFKPISPPDNHRLQHADYSEKAKMRAQDPEKFTGDLKTFGIWVRMLADKFEEDHTCFRSEASRMQYIVKYTADHPLDQLQARYNKTRQPFRCAAEMIQTLEGSYADPNEGANARRALQDLHYKPGTKDMPFHKFLGVFKSTAVKAGTADQDMKTVLYEHIPPGMGPHLYGMSKDDSVDFDDFCRFATEAAYVQDMQYQYRQKTQRTRGGEGGKNTAGGKPSQPSSSTPKPAAAKDGVAKGRRLTEAEKKVHWDAGTCFNCGKPGHKSAECPKKATSTSTPAPGVSSIQTSTRQTQRKEEDSSDEESDSGNESGH
jgi:hypothetical protein